MPANAELETHWADAARRDDLTVGERFDLYTEMVTTPDGKQWTVEARCPQKGSGEALISIRCSPVHPTGVSHGRAIRISAPVWLR